MNQFEDEQFKKTQRNNTNELQNKSVKNKII